MRQAIGRSNRAFWKSAILALCAGLLAGCTAGTGSGQPGSAPSAAAPGTVGSPPAQPPIPSPERHEFTRLVMGVATRIVVYAPSLDAASDAAAGAFHRLAELEQSMSDYRPTSEISRLAEHPGIPQPISPDLLEVLTIAGTVTRHSGGMFDVTIGPLSRLWRASRKSGSLPAADQLAAARAKVGPDKLTLDPAASSVTLAAQGMQLDLGGIAKGYAAEQAVRYLRQRGHPQCLVALAGDVAAGDAPPGRPGWRVEVARRQLPGHTGPAAEPLAVWLVNQSISTSGDSEQFIELGGTRYTHMLDPATGLGSPGGVTVTVISPRGAVADALSTALCLVSSDRVAPIVLTADLRPCAAIIQRDGAAAPVVIDPTGLIIWAQH